MKTVQATKTATRRGRDYKSLFLRPTGYAIMPLVNEVLKMAGLWKDEFKYGKNNRHKRHLLAVTACEKNRGLYDRAVAARSKGKTAKVAKVAKATPKAAKTAKPAVTEISPK